jgi:ubiquitin-conjugating enzyme E2 J2
MSNILVSRLSKEYKSIQTSPLPNAIIVPEPTNWLHWHFLLHSLSGDFTSGVYHGELRFPSDFPMSPPTILMHTPNGRFVPGDKICVSMSSFHPETWSPSWTISGIVVALISYMYEDEQGVGTVLSSPMAKRALAKESLSMNKQNEKFVNIFEDYLHLFKEEENKEEEKEEKEEKRKRENSGRMKNLSIAAVGILVPFLLFVILYVSYFDW